MIVNNNNINFSNYYNILNFLGDTLANHNSIASVKQGPIYDIENYSFPAYPFANFMISNISIYNNTTIYAIQLIVGDKVKDLNKNVDENQVIDFYGTDDEVDVFANTNGIINDILSYLDGGTTAFRIDGTINLTPFSDKYKNGISGYSVIFNLVTFNNRNRCE